MSPHSMGEKSAQRGKAGGIGERFTPEAADALRREIAEAEGNEVFAVGTLDSSGKIATLEVVARGSSDAVPALASFFETGSVLVHNHPSGKLSPSQADVDIAAEAGSYGIGSYIVDNAVERLRVVAEPVRDRTLLALDSEGLAAALDSGGALASRLPNFEPRPAQVALTRDAAEVFNDGGILAAEAGTGVGKSFAYLVPSMAWAVGNGNRVVISTATINLQDQLFGKDIPLVSSLFRKPVKTVLVKGRSNYLCRYRLEEAVAEEGLFASGDNPLHRILAWDDSGASGDRAELPFRIDDETWSKVCSEGDFCLSLRCPHRQACHVITVRKNAADAQIVVVNHHLLFADLSARGRSSGLEQTAILPSYGALVMDEAHSLESSATSLFSESFSRFSIGKKIARLSRKSRKGDSGALSRYAKLPGAAAVPGTLADALKSMSAAAADMESGALLLMGTRGTLRFKPAEAQSYLAIRDAAGRLQRSSLQIVKEVTGLLGALPESSLQETAAYEVKLVARGFSEIADLAARFKDPAADPESILWCEKSRTSRKEIFVEFISTPLEVSGILERDLFSKVRTVVCTSATLTVGGSFDFWRRRVGIRPEREDVMTKTYPSPFPFSTQALLAVDTSAPSPQKAKSAWSAHLSHAVPDLLTASRGRALVLFTSYETLNSVYEASLPVMTNLGIACLKQGMDDRARLLAMFRKDISSVLFATDSFWEGIDAPGETLSMVVITKLPFRVPDDPVLEARAEAVEKRGGSSFSELSVPEAIIKFKQGFGRLIRHSDDRGVAVVLDSRLAASAYGNLFVQSLPRCRISLGDTGSICSEVTKFLDA